MTITNQLELTIHRKNTKRFIDADPTKITLIPKFSAYLNGTKIFGADFPRAEQTFKVIWNGDNGIVREIDTGVGGVRRFDFVLVGEHDAILEVGDHWKVNDQTFVVEYVYPTNDYEVKGGGVTHGNKPDG